MRNDDVVDRVVEMYNNMQANSKSTSIEGMLIRILATTSGEAVRPVVSVKHNYRPNTNQKQTHNPKPQTMLSKSDYSNMHRCLGCGAENYV